MSWLIFVGILALIVALIGTWGHWRHSHRNGNSYIVTACGDVLRRLSCLSLWELMKAFRPNLWLFDPENQRDTETWVVLGLAFSMATFAIISPSCALAEPLVWYGLLASHGIVFVQLRIILVDRGPATDPRRSAVLALLNYFQVVFWFALAYRCLSALFNPAILALDAQLDSFFLSLATMTLLGADSADPQKPLGWLVQFSQVCIGFVMTVVILAYSVSAIMDNGD
jgi:hypothetical protein